MIDLNTCKKGDILISSQGMKLEYVAKTPYKHYSYLDHVVKYPVNEFGRTEYGTRTNDGFVFAKNRQPKTDHDIVKIIRKSQNAKPIEIKIVSFATAKLLRQLEMPSYLSEKGYDSNGEKIDRFIPVKSIDAPFLVIAKNWIRKKYGLYIEVEKINFGSDGFSFYLCSDSDFLDVGNGLESTDYDKLLDEAIRLTCEYILKNKNTEL